MGSWNLFKKDTKFKKDDPSKLLVRGKYLISKISEEDLINRKHEMANNLFNAGFYITRSPLFPSEELYNSQIFNFRAQLLTEHHIVTNFSDRFESLLIGQNSVQRAYFRRLRETRDDLPIDVTVRFTQKTNFDDKDKIDCVIEVVIFPCKYIKYSQLIEHQAKFKIDDLEFFSTPSVELAKDIGASLKGEEIQEPNVVDKEKIPPEIVKSLHDFRNSYPSPKKVGFILMPFEKSEGYDIILKTIKNVLQENGCFGVRADDRIFHNDVLYNILTYLHGCDFGIALFDKSEITTFNPNVSLEVGFLLALNKPVFLLKDQNLPMLQSDLAGKLYFEFDPQDIEKTISPMLKKWLSDKII